MQEYIPGALLRFFCTSAFSHKILQIVLFGKPYASHIANKSHYVFGYCRNLYTEELLNHIMISSQLLHQEQNQMIEILTKEFLFFTSNYIIATLLQQMKSI